MYGGKEVAGSGVVGRPSETGDEIVGGEAIGDRYSEGGGASSNKCSDGACIMRRQTLACVI